MDLQSTTSLNHMEIEKKNWEFLIVYLPLFSRLFAAWKNFFICFGLLNLMKSHPPRNSVNLLKYTENASRAIPHSIVCARLVDYNRIECKRPSESLSSRRFPLFLSLDHFMCFQFTMRRQQTTVEEVKNVQLVWRELCAIKHLLFLFFIYCPPHKKMWRKENEQKEK